MSSSPETRQEPRAKTVSLTKESLTVDLMDGRQVSVPLAWYPRLWYGTTEERENFEIFGDGGYIHWPDVDEDLTVGGIVEGRRSMESAESIKKWLNERKDPGKQVV